MYQNGCEGFPTLFFLTWCLNTVLVSFRGGRSSASLSSAWGLGDRWQCHLQGALHPSVGLPQNGEVGVCVSFNPQKVQGMGCTPLQPGGSRASKRMDYHGMKLSSGFQSLCSHLSKNMLQSPEAAVTFHAFIPPVRKPRPGIKDFAMNIICQRATQCPKSQGILFLHSCSFYSTELSLKHTCTLVQEATTDLSSPLVYASIHACEHSDCLSVIVCVCTSMFSMWVCECACFCTCMIVCVFWVWKEKIIIISETQLWARNFFKYLHLISTCLRQILPSPTLVRWYNLKHRRQVCENPPTWYQKMGLCFLFFIFSFF